MKVTRVSEENKSLSVDFLKKRKELCVFLLDNLTTCGFDPIEGNKYSGEFSCILGESEEIVCVFCKSLAKTVLIQGDGKDYSDEIMGFVEFGDVIGVLGDSTICDNIQRKLIEKRIWKGSHGAPESLMELPLSGYNYQIDENSSIPTEEDFEEYSENGKKFCEETKVPVSRSSEEERTRFNLKVKNKEIFVTYLPSSEKKKVIISQSVLNSRSFGLGVIGGVFTKKEYRRKGYSTKNLMKLIETSIKFHNLEKLILFTGIDSGPEKLYSRLGFKRIGLFGLYFSQK